jgi:hypothetical protein
VECRVVTMEQLLTELDAPVSGPIHLLKVDVEGAELIVLEGVSDAVWARIRQVVVEVHDVDNRLEVIKRMLAAKGFDKLAVESEEWETHKLKLSTIFAYKSVKLRSTEK